MHRVIKAIRIELQSSDLDDNTHALVIFGAHETNLKKLTSLQLLRDNQIF